MQKARALAARLDSTTDDLLRQGRALFATQQTLAWVEGEERCLATQELTEAMRLKKVAELERNALAKEVHDWEQRFDALKRTASGSVSGPEVDRSLLLVATLWHAAGRKAPPDASLEGSQMRTDDALNAWRLYFNRDARADPPYIRPNSNLVLEH